MGQSYDLLNTGRVRQYYTYPLFCRSLVIMKGKKLVLGETK